MALRVSIAAVALGVLSSCTGGHAKVSGPSTTLAPTSSATDVPGVSNVTPATVSTTFTGIGSDTFCQLARSFDETFRQLDPSSNDVGATRTLFRGVSSALDQAAAVAAPEIKPDIVALAAVYREVLVGLERVNFDYTQLSPDISAKLGGPSVEVASTRAKAYMQKVCKIF